MANVNVVVLIYDIIQHMKRKLAIVNPVSGGNRAKKAFLWFRDYVDGSIEVFISERPKSILDRFYELCDRDELLIFGGDGTLNEVINAIFSCNIGTLPKLTVFPAGSGNDFVKNLPVGQLVKFYPGVFQYDGQKRYFLNVVGTGLDAYTAYYARDVKGRYLRGVAAYAYGLGKTLLMGNSTIGIRHSTIDIPDISSILIFGRGQYAGGGFYLLPHANVYIPMIYWLASSKLSPWDIIINAPILFNGKILDYWKVSYGESNDVHVELVKEEVFQIDGEILTGISSFSVYVSDRPVYVRYFSIP